MQSNEMLQEMSLAKYLLTTVLAMRIENTSKRQIASYMRD